MGKETGIEWTEHTFNPWWGCTKVSPACAHCYAEAWDKRTGGEHWGEQAPRRFFGEKHWNEPLKWNAAADKAGIRQRVFCASMADVFEDRRELDEPRKRLWELIERTPALDWLLLTKRPELMTSLAPWKVWPVNVWAGTTAENQEWYDRRFPELAKVPAIVRFLSIEPLLGAIDLRYHPEYSPMFKNDPPQWVICGGESGPGARPMHPDWTRSVRNQCVGAGVPFFFKQWGDQIHTSQLSDSLARDIDAHLGEIPERFWGVGKKRAGRLLDGREWNEVPVARQLTGT